MQRNTDYINATADGIGYDRTVATGSGYIGQYRPSVAAQLESLDTCPDELVGAAHHFVVAVAAAAAANARV